MKVGLSLVKVFPRFLSYWFYPDKIRRLDAYGVGILCVLTWIGLYLFILNYKQF
jgi:hypothetical protein